MQSDPNTSCYRGFATLARTSFSFFIVCIFANFAFAQPSPPDVSNSDNTITVQLRDGRTLMGQVDVRTDDEVFWLRVARDSVWLSTGFTWDLVQHVDSGKQRYSAAQFRDLADLFASKLARPETNDASPSKPRQPSPTRNILSPLAIRHDRVQFLKVEAEIANWDRDAESDGVTIRVLPTAIDGRILPVDGVIAVQLVGRSFVSAGQSQGFPMLGQWSQRIRAADFSGPAGAVYQLTLPRTLDHDLSIVSIGMVQTQLNVFGQGSFDAEAPIRLRSYNPIRDQKVEHRLRYDSFGRYRARHW